MSFRSALSHRGFLALWLGQLASRIGDSIHEIALVWLVYEVTGDPVYLSITFALSFIPTTLFSVPAGVLSDRVNRKYILIVSDLLRATIVLSIPLLGHSPLLIPTVFVVAFVTGLVDAVDNPARMALIPNLVPEEDLDAANSLSSLTFSASRVLLAVGGAAVAIFGSFSAFYLDSASFFLSAFLTVLIPTRCGVPEQDGTEAADASSKTSVASAIRRAVDDAKVVLGFISDHRLLQNLMLITVTLQFVIGPVTVGLPVFIDPVPLEGSFLLGLLYATFYAGMVFGSVLVSYYSELIEPHRGRLIVGGLGVFGGSLMIAVHRVPQTLPETAIMLAFVALSGIAFAAVNVSNSTLKHVLVPNDRLGRYTSFVTTVAGVGSIVGLGLTGPVVNLIGAKSTILLNGVTALVVALFLVLQPIRRVTENASNVREVAAE